jgi:hypothetical protein
MKERRKTERSKKLMLSSVAAVETPVEMDSMIKEVSAWFLVAGCSLCVLIWLQLQVEKDFYRLIDTNASAALSAEKASMDQKSKAADTESKAS